MTNIKKDSFFGKVYSFLFKSSVQSNLRERNQDVIEESSRNGHKSSNLSNKEKVILENILTINKLKASDVMIPRAEIVCAPNTASYKDLIAIIKKESHSRIPIYRKDLDDVLGMVHIKDLIQQNYREIDNEFNLKSILKNVLFIPPSMPVLNILLKMQSTKLHMALVIDEHGGTDGLVTIEDLVEEIVGEIQDEHDHDELVEFEKINETTFIANAKMQLVDFEKKTNFSFNVNNVDTLGGYVFSIINRVPQKGENIKSNPIYTFEILDADPRKIKVLKIYKS